MVFIFVCSYGLKHLMVTALDAPPSSLMDLTANPKMKITEGEGVRARSLACSILEVEGHIGAPRWGLGRLTSKLITHTNLHKNKEQVG